MRNIAEALSNSVMKEINKLDFLDVAEILEVHYETGTDEFGNKYIPGTAKIVLQDGVGESQLDNVPILTLNASADSGIIMFPQQGDNVVIAYLEPDKHAPIIVGSFYNTELNPLFNTTEGEWIIKHPSGSSIKFDNDGNIILSVPDGAEVKVI